MALAFPAVFVNVTHGHNGFVTAALLGGAMLVLDRRPLLAGVLIGCLAYKPQFGLLVPLVLAATGRWRTIAAAGLTVLSIAGLTWAAFGTDVFVAFWQSLPMAQSVVLEGAPGFHKIQSVYAALRLAGVPVSAANAAQALVTLATAVGAVMLWRSAAVFELKAAGLMIASLIATPYVLDYDLVVLAPAIAFLVAHGLRRGICPLRGDHAGGHVGAAAGGALDCGGDAVSLTPIVLLAALGLILDAPASCRPARCCRGGREEVSRYRRPMSCRPSAKRESRDPHHDCQPPGSGIAREFRMTMPRR